jgi:transcription elongation GreA/GreB family factor
LKQLKEKLYAYCQNWIDEKIKLAQSTIDNAQSSANEETKSSAGDKYETGRAMAQQEVEKGSMQLAEASKLNSLMNLFSANTSDSTRITLGSLVHTDRDWFYISVSAGKVVINGKSVICLSSASPLGAQMIGLSRGQVFKFNRLTYMIEDIF